MRFLSSIVALLILFIAAPAYAKPSFDCGTARLPAELTICRVINLGDMDAQIASQFSEIMSLATEADKGELKSEQRAWLQQRNACGADIGCLLTVMPERRLALGRKLDEMRKRVPSWTLFKPSFTCTERSKDVEKAICGDEVLARSDRELVESYKNALERVGVQGVDQLKTAQRAWVAKRNSCGSDGDCISRAMRDRIAELENVLGPAPAVPPPAVKSAALCSSDAAMLARAAGSVAVKLHDPGGVKAGQPIRVSWRRDNWNLPDATSVHLMLVLPEWVRFSGKYLLPLPPGAPAPASLKHGLDKMRVVLPLTSAHAPRADEIAVKAYRAGPLRIEYALLAKSSCGETVVKSGQLPEVLVDAGAPEIVMQDFFTLEKSEGTIISNNGRYRLEVFPGSYRVFDVATGVKIADRVGIEPNFSPEARFVGAFVGLDGRSGRRLELFDLVALLPVPGMIAFGPTVGWALKDGVLFDGTAPFNEVKVRVYRTLIDDHGPPDAVGTSPHIEVEHAKGYAWSRFNISLFPELARIAISGLETQIFDLASFRPTGAGQELAELGTSVKLQNVRDALLKEGVTSFTGFDGWQADGPVRLSHIDEAVEFGVAGNEERFKGTILPSSRLVRHAGTASASAASGGSKSAIVVSADWRSRSTRSVRPVGVDNDLSRFAERLSEFGVCVDAACKGIPRRNPVENYVASSTFERNSNFINWDHVAKFTKPASELQREIVRDVPAARKSIATPDEDLGWHEFPDNSDRRDRRVRFRLTEEPEGYSGVNGLWRWSVDGRTNWLTQQVYGWRGGFNASSVVMYLAGPKGGQIINLSAADRNSDDQDGLHKAFLGEKSDPLVRVRPFLYDDRWLLIAAPAGSSAAIVDLQRPDTPTFMYGLKDVHDTRYLLRSHDGRRLVQLNTDGRFHIYEIPSGKLVVSGRYIDDEIIFYTPEGYYWSSYEGAHYVHARFAGRDGLYSLQQFARMLNRPDIVKAALTGTAGTPPNPQLQAPPELEVALNKFGDTQIELTVTANASAILKEFRVYQDGKPTRIIPASGANFKGAITVDREPQARWLTVVAVDTAGLTSVPVTAPIEAPQRAANTLHLLAVGVDEYEHLSRLAFAKVDAETITGASRVVKGSYYADVQATLLKDREATADQILKSLEAKASEARAGDTLMLFFAGHGARSPDGRFFMTTSTTRAEDLDGTALEWSRLAKVLGRTKARVIVLLDACHSGQAGAQLQATNDDAVAAISGASRSPMLVFAASKGRQESKELPGAGGGVFTQALAGLITRGRDEQDLNRNGVLEVSEVFGALKDAVTRATNGQQTPWLVRQDMVGDFAVF